MSNIKNSILKFFTWLLFILLIPSSYASNELQHEIYIVFRFDDYSARSNTELETNIISLFKEYNLAFTIGVIPYVAADDIYNTNKQELLPLNSYKSDILKKAYNEGIVEIALHGYSHQTINNNNIRSEFSGLEYSTQKDKINKGKSFLENITGTTIFTFIPPWNSYDYKTLNILEELKFNNISADRFGVLELPSNINFYPSTCNILQIKEAIKSCENSQNESTIILALFHEYDFKEVNPSEGQLEIEDLNDILHWVSKKDNINVLTINNLADIVSKEQIENKYILNNKTIVLSRFLPGFFKPSTEYTYASKSYFRSMLYYLILYYSLVFSFSIIITILLSKVYYKKYTKLFNTIKYIALILLFFIIIILFIKSQIGYNIITLLDLIFAINLGIWIGINIFKQKKEML